MLALGGMLGVMLIAIFIGKHTKEIHPSSYILIALLALLQIFLLLVKIYTMFEPSL